jgi:uncharacterized protein
MATSLPVQQAERVVIVDVVRGFALVGVLIANFTSFIDQNLPSDILNSISTPFDQLLSNLNTIFIEWKFMTIFSILFGYGFGLILISLEKKSIHPTSFFTRRMFWLFVMGIIHTLFWWGDILHLYALCGLLLLPFRKFSTGMLLLCSLFFMFVIPPCISLAFQNSPDYFTDQNMKLLYEQYKYGNMLDVFKSNINLYYKAFILSGSDLHDMSETLGRFLFGYLLLRMKLFESIKMKKQFFKNVSIITASVTIGYLMIRWLSREDMTTAGKIYREPLTKIGILSTSCLYVSVLVLLFIAYERSKIFSTLQALGKMTLTNYLLISAICITLLYGIGFGQLGTLSMRIMWLCAFVWLIIEISFSTYWLKKFRYGPTEWIWRRLTYRKRIPMRK